MPTESQLEVLYQECYWVWTANYNGSNKAGYIVYKAKEEKDKGKAVKSGEEPLSAYSLADVHIFLPAAGVYVGNELLGVGEYGCIWSLELPSSDENKSEHLGLGPEYIYYDFTERYKSNNIRPVIKQ